jgi:hypothetical protein
LLCAGLVGNARATGLTINVPLVGRVTGGGGVLFATAVDVTNNGSSVVAVDFYFDGRDGTNGQTVSVAGTIGNFGLVSRGAGAMSPLSNQHFDDFIDSLVMANMLASSFRDDGIQGSLLLVFNGYTKRGQGAATARFYNAFGGGNVGVSLRGHEIAASEPQKLVVTVRDTTAISSTGQVYPNLFINNTGLAPDGTAATADINVQVSAVSAATGQPTGTPINLTIASGQTATVGRVFQALGITPSADTTTLLVYATVTSGSAAIEGLVSQVDTVTKDGSAFEMVRAD